jgi:hypothetical protein
MSIVLSLFLAAALAAPTPAAEDPCTQTITSAVVVFVFPELPVGDGGPEQIRREMREFDQRREVRDQILRLRRYDASQRVKLATCQVGARRLSFRNPDGENAFEVTNGGGWLGVVVFCPGKRTTVLPGVSKDEVLFPLIAECSR